jgi:hypothetical protein
LTTSLIPNACHPGRSAGHAQTALRTYHLDLVGRGFRLDRSRRAARPAARAGNLGGVERTHDLLGQLRTSSSAACLPQHIEAQPLRRALNQRLRNLLILLLLLAGLAALDDFRNYLITAA